MFINDRIDTNYILYILQLTRKSLTLNVYFISDFNKNAVVPKSSTEVTTEVTMYICMYT